MVRDSPGFRLTVMMAIIGSAFALIVVILFQIDQSDESAISTWLVFFGIVYGSLVGLFFSVLFYWAMQPENDKMSKDIKSAMQFTIRHHCTYCNPRHPLVEDTTEEQKSRNGAEFAASDPTAGIRVDRGFLLN